jgi:ribonuclease P protein component
MSFPLDKSRRIRRNSEYERVYSGGIKSPGKYILAVMKPAEGPLRVGMTVSRKVGCACVRNLVKRRIREAVRQELDPSLSGWELVLIARKGAGDAPFFKIAQDVRRIAGKLAEIKAGVPNPTVKPPAISHDFGGHPAGLKMRERDKP